MKKVFAIFVGVAMLFAAFFIISISASASKKKDQNCINRCIADNKKCYDNAKGLKVIDRMASEDECIRQKNTCIALCPENL